MPGSSRSSTWIAPLLGALLGSGAVAAAAVALIPVYYPPHPDYEWVKAGVPPTDCGAIDTGQTYSSEPPISCTARDQGTIAICWDGKEYKNAANGMGCTYKATHTRQMHGRGKQRHSLGVQASFETLSLRCRYNALV
jgi:hypothetical protein